MKLTLALVSALAATVSASPIRIIALSSPPEYPPAADAIRLASADDAGSAQAVPPPCQGGGNANARGDMAVPPGPIGALLTRLGLTSSVAQPHPPHPHHSEHAADNWEVISAMHDKEAAHRVMDSWKHHVEEMFQPVGDRILPIMEGGAVRILPVDDTNRDELDRPAVYAPHGEAHPGWKSLEGSHGVKKHHHHAHGGPHGHGHGHGGQPRRFICRLGRALRSLTPTEATALMFVLGAGLGSLLHLAFAMIFITVRMLRGKRGACAARRAARREARRVRKEERRSKKAGGIRLDGQEHEHDEALPSYAEGETDRLVEKA